MRMLRHMYQFGRFMVVSRRHRRVRAGLLFLLKNFFLLTAIILAAEVVLLLLAVNDVYIPLSRSIQEIVAKLVL